MSAWRWERGGKSVGSMRIRKRGVFAVCFQFLAFNRKEVEVSMGKKSFLLRKWT